MNTITDVNKNIEQLGLNVVSEETSILSSLFAISFKSEDMLSENVLKSSERMIGKEKVYSASARKWKSP